MLKENPLLPSVSKGGYTVDRQKHSDEQEQLLVEDIMSLQLSLIGPVVLDITEPFQESMDDPVVSLIEDSPLDLPSREHLSEMPNVLMDT